MNKIILSLLICLAGVTASAQSTNIEVSYTALSPNFRDGKVDVKNHYVLIANAKESKFYSPKTEYLDSLNSSPEGSAKLKEITRAAYLGGKMDEMPRKDGSYYVVKNLSTNSLRYYDTAGLDKYYYDETPEEWAWEISDSTKNILGYECFKATADFHGRRWEAWFAPEIPMTNGPWKLGALPGLILEAATVDGLYGFTASGLQETSKNIGSIYLAEEYEKTDRKSLLKAKRSFLENPLGNINAKMAGRVVISGGSGNQIFAATDTVDFIETDYR